VSAPLLETDERKLVANPLVRLFASADLRSLALMRIALGVLLIGDILPRIAEVDAFYSNDGVLTNHFALFRPLAPYQLSFYFAASSTRDVTVVFLLTLLVYLLFTVGYRTRLFHILSFVCATSLHTRNLLTELPSDAVLHLWLAWSLFLPLGARFSVDSLRKSLAERREKSPPELNERPLAPLSVSSLAVLGVVLQLSAMHIAAALRQSGPTWTDGTALYYALHHNLWTTAAGAWLGRAASLDTLKQLTHTYRFSQIALGVLMLVPVVYLRRITVVLLVLFHLLSRALFDVGPYDLALLGAAPILISSRDWGALKAWYTRHKRAKVVYFDADCGICLMICRWLVRFDTLGRLTFAANASEDAPPEVKAAAAETVVVRDEKSGRTFTKSRALAAIMASLPLGGPFALLLRAPGIAQLADALYNRVAENRAAISVWLGFQACGVPQRPAPPHERSTPLWPGLRRKLVVAREMAVVAFACLCGAALWQGTLPEATAPNLARPVFAALSYPRIFQKWGLFAPDPPKDMGVLVVDAWTGRGTRFDPLTGAPPLESPEPPLEGDSGTRPSALKRAYFSRIHQHGNSTYLDGLRDYVTRVSDERPVSERPTAYTIFWLEAPIPSPEGALVSAHENQVMRRRLTARP
jgi:predicted DCC family thiol-disulfide oxidoreductase YuxK